MEARTKGVHMSKELLDRIQELLLENASLKEDRDDLKEMCREQFDRISLYGTRLNDCQEALKKIADIVDFGVGDAETLHDIAEALDDVL